MKNNFIKALRQKRALERVEATIKLHSATGDALCSLLERKSKIDTLSLADPDLKSELVLLEAQYNRLHDFYSSIDCVVNCIQHYYEGELYLPIIKYFPKKSLKLIKKSVSDPIQACLVIERAECEIRSLLYVTLCGPFRGKH